jgi:hypothetical protein
MNINIDIHRCPPEAGFRTRNLNNDNNNNSNNNNNNNNNNKQQQDKGGCLQI